MNKQTALNFADAINAHDVSRILSLMTEDHVFIDSYGNSESREAMTQGWPGYFSWFPDYKIEIGDVLESGDTVVLLGYAGGTYRGDPKPENRWRIPAAWRVIVENDLVKVWQVYADSKIPYEIMEKADKRRGERIS